MTERTQNLLAIFLVVSWLIICSDVMYEIIKGIIEWLIVKPISQIIKWLFGE